MDTTTVANAITRDYGPMVMDYLYFNNELLMTMEALGMDTGGGFDRESNQGDRHTFPVIYDENFTTEVYTEHASLPANGYTDSALCYATYTYIWTALLMSSRAEDFLRNGGYFEAIDRDMQVAARKLRDLRNTHMLGSTYNGLLHAIDNTGTYLNQNRASATWFRPLVSANSGVNRSLTLALMEGVEDAIPETPYGGRPNVIITSRTQGRNYAQLPGVIGADNAAPRIVLNNGAPTSVDLAVGNKSFGNRPIIEVDGFDTSEMLFLEMGPDVKFRVSRAMRTEWQDNTGDNRRYKITHGYSGFIFEQLNHQARIADLSA